MNRLLWLVPPAFLLVGAAGGYVMGQTEPYPYAYRNLSEAWPRFSPAMKDRIKAIMADGKMTEWEWRDIEADTVKDAGYLTGTISEAPDLEADRERLQALIQEPTN